MHSLKAIIIMFLWSAAALTTLYYLGAFEHFRSPIWIIPIASALLGVHVVNMVIYFKIAGDAPYQWRKRVTY